MAKQKNEKNMTVIINLDRPRTLRYGHRALKLLSSLTGKTMKTMTENDFDLAELEKVIFCGLLSDSKENNETLKLEDMEDLLDKADSFGDIIEAMNQALDNAFESTEKQKN